MKVLPKMGERHAKGRAAAVGARERSREDGAAAGRGRKHAGETERERGSEKARDETSGEGEERDGSNFDSKVSNADGCGRTRTIGQWVER